ncbi:helix-turn-helix domain-containing protein [Dactylosporangium sp. CS-033363]|uniref:helix-turn-helix domain-containing protein n=1 Tax=Dactylosporangium sp. CS-033363 TaxID=3239935 RepID=UPI003D920094
MAVTQGRQTSLRRLRDQLKRMREERSLQQVEVAQKLDWSTSKLIRIENGTVGISVTDLRALTGIYDAPAGEVEHLVELVRQTKGRTWWSSYPTINAAYKNFIGFELDASRMLQYHLSIIPGLLQTQEYMRVLIPALRLEPTAQPALEDLYAVRIRRQREIVEAEEGADITMLIDEAALRRPVGGPAVMREQYRHLQRAAASPRLTVAVLPLAAGPHAGLAGGFTIMEFADDVDGDLLVQENATGNILLQDQPELVESYRKAFEGMLAHALRDERAVEFLETLVQEQG